MISEMKITEQQKQQRKQDRENQGFWVCDKCETKYYLGLICDTCLGDELRKSVKGLK